MVYGMFKSGLMCWFALQFFGAAHNTLTTIDTGSLEFFLCKYLIYILFPLIQAVFIINTFKQMARDVITLDVW